MRKAIVAACLGLIWLLPVPGARAELATIDAVPAATLLLPYFEVDLSNPNGMTTVFTVVNSGNFGTPPDTNSSAQTAALAHVTLWTDLGIPTIAFDLYFTGFDVVSVNLRDVFNGNLPTTASDGQDPSDTISPQGQLSQDLNFPGCFSKLPYANPALTPVQVTGLRDAHTGKASGLLGGDCAGRDLGDNIARGFITIDDVFACSDLFPPVFPTTGFFGSIAGRRNLYAGDFQYADLTQNFAQGDALVAIQADPALMPSFGAGDYTFYGRFVGGDGSDRREPLATRWAAPYQDKPAHGLRTDLIVWRDPITAPAPFACGGPLPAPFPLGAKQLVGFDTAENPTTLMPMAAPFPVVAQRVRINGPGSNLTVSPRAGWLFLDLNSPSPVASSPFTDKSARQSWVMVVKHAEGRFSNAHAAIQLDNAFTPR